MSYVLLDTTYTILYYTILYYTLHILYIYIYYTYYLIHISYDWLSDPKHPPGRRSLNQLRHVQRAGAISIDDLPTARKKNMLD